MSLSKFGLALFLLAWPSIVVAQAPRFEIGSPSLQSIWVDPDRGDDRASGRNAGEALRTIVEAWNRIPAGAARANAGYDIRLLPGEYAEAAIPH